VCRTFITAEAETILLPFSSQPFRRLWPAKKELAASLQSEDAQTPQWRKRIATICLVIFLLAIGVRLFHWQDNRPIFPKLFTGMVEHYKSNARLLLKGDVAGFITGPAPPGEANILTYPPGYPIILAVVFKVFGESDAAMRLFQILCDAGATVLLFLIAAELLPIRAAVFTGTLAALSPQLAYYSLILIPDSLATLPILLAIYFTIRAKKSNSFPAIVAAGALVGVSCWLRANALMLAPFLAVMLLVTIERARRWRFALTLVASTILVIAPITIRNLVVFHHFIPLSLGVGQMLNFGITDFDKERRYGLPGTDIEIVSSEARQYGRPEYAESLFGVNGIERDKQRTARALTVVRAHPIWFGGVVLRRAVSMLRLERVHRIATTPGVMSSLEVAAGTQPAWSRAPSDLVQPAPADFTLQTQANTTLSPDGQALILDSPAMGLNHEIDSEPIPVAKNTDYLLRIPILVEQRNVVVEISNPEQTERYGSTPVLNPLERINATDQSLDVHQVAFVSRDTDRISLFLNSVDHRNERTLVRLGRPELFRLGPASFLWTRHIRVLINIAQRFFITAWILPLAFLGVTLLLLAERVRDILILLAVPAYYLCVQSFLHTEYRYVLAAQPFLYAMAGVALYFLWLTIRRMVGRRRESNS
jgi:4-amino-4-deoxy-L-arabinose transferase-like glycosyltransferase